MILLMPPRRCSYSTLREIIERKCPPEHTSDLWLLYRHGWMGVAPIGEIPEANGTRLYVHGAYFSADKLDDIRAKIDMDWERESFRQVSFDVMRYRQWLSLEEATSMIFYKRLLEARGAKIWKNRMRAVEEGRARIIPYER